MFACVSGPTIDTAPILCVRQIECSNITMNKRARHSNINVATKLFLRLITTFNKSQTNGDTTCQMVGYNMMSRFHE